VQQPTRQPASREPQAVAATPHGAAEAASPAVALAAASGNQGRNGDRDSPLRPLFNVYLLLQHRKMANV